MKLTKSQLKQIIKEEITKVFGEDLEQRTGPAPGRGTEIAAQSVPEKVMSAHQGAPKYNNDEIKVHCQQTYDPEKRSTEDYSKCVRSLGGMAE